jgi:hypothetical protein
MIRLSGFDIEDFECPILARRNQAFAIRRPAYVDDPQFVRAEPMSSGAGQQIPNIHHTIFAAHGELPITRCKREREDVSPTPTSPP